MSVKLRMPSHRRFAAQVKVTFLPIAAIFLLASGVGVFHVTVMKQTDTDLTGKLLIAMPEMADPRFAGSVIFICAHSDDGAMGLIVNRPLPDLRLPELLSQLDIPHAAGVARTPVHFGGPVDNVRGFVLHSRDYVLDDGTMVVDDNYAMTSSLQVLEDIAAGVGPNSAMLALGYSGWGPGQLEYEIGQNGWLSCDATFNILFGRDNDAKWTGALKSMGVDPLLLSAAAGHA